MEGEINILDYIRTAWRGRYFIIGAALISMIIAWGMAAREPKMYRAETSLLMSGGGGGGGAASVLTSVLGSSDGGIDYKNIIQSRSLAEKMVSDKYLAKGQQMASKALDQAGKEQMNRDIFSSRIVAEKVTDNLNLKQYFPEVKDKYDLVSVVRGSIQMKPEGGIVKMYVEAQNPELTVLLSNGYLAAFEEYVQKNNIQTARRTRLFTEKQLADANIQLRRAEERLRYVGEKNETYFTSDIQREIMMNRLKRDVEVNATRYSMLLAQLEDARLEEEKEGQFFNVLDPPQLPTIPYKPNVKFKTIVGGLMGLFGSIFIVFFWEYIRVIWEEEQKKKIGR